MNINKGPIQKFIDCQASCKSTNHNQIIELIKITNSSARKYPFKIVAIR